MAGRRRAWFRACLVVVGLSTFGCRGQPAATPPQQTEETKQQIELQLNWIPDAQHGGFYAALEHGYFAREGLDVKITPGGPGTAVLPKVAMGRCDFAIANADQVLLAREQGADVVAVYAAMQDSPRCIMVHAASGFERLDQLRDVSLALGDGKAFAEYMKAHLPMEGVRIVSYSGSVAKFLVDPQFAQQGYVFSEPLVARAQGGDPRALMVSDLGFNPYSSVVVTSQALLDRDPDRVRRFVSAVRDGWKAYLEDPTQANRVIQSVNPEMDAEILKQSVEAIRPLCGRDRASFGSMKHARWERLRQQLRELGLLGDDGPSAESAFVTLDP